MTKDEFIKELKQFINGHEPFAKPKSSFIEAYNNATNLSNDDKDKCIKALLNYAKNYGVKKV